MAARYRLDWRVYMVAKSAILVDFDNVFSTLWDLDRDAATRFASEPADWLQVLANTHLAGDARRWLVARCYLNPAGFVHVSGSGQDRLYFTRFRPALMRAGFEVIDCPAVARGGKNAADIRMVIDALDLLGHATRFDEVVLASGDSDFTPLLQRLRASDRLVTIVSPGYLSTIYTALADKVIGFDEIRGLLVADADEPAPVRTALVADRSATGAESGSDTDVDTGAFRELIVQRYESTNVPLNLAALALEAARACPGAKQSQWYGRGSFSAAVRAMELPRARFSQHHLWDEERHQAPAATTAEALEQPEAVELLCRSLDLPRIKQEHWPRLFEALSAFAAANEFNLTEATRWCRDRLAADGIHVSRNAIGYVARGCQFGGAKLDPESKAGAAELGRAFLAAVLDRASALAVQVEAEAENEIASWIGVHTPAPSDG